MREKTCCFIGHEIFQPDTLEDIQQRICDEIDNLYSQGVTDFISGGVFGFDLLAATMVFVKKHLENLNIRLIFVLPCREFDKSWPAKMKLSYRNLFTFADDVIYVAEEFSRLCIAKRNRYMIDNSAYCICTLFSNDGGAAHTVNYAEKQGLKIIDVAKK